MKVLHLFSNWKWTGPSEHALNLAAHLTEKGCDLTFACGRPPVTVEDSLEKRAKEIGLNLMQRLYLNKHFNIWHNVIDVGRLTRLLTKEKCELIHTHLLNDHIIAGVAAKCVSKRILIVRTVYDGEGLSNNIKNKILLSQFTDGLIVVSESSKVKMEGRFNFPSERIWKICPGVDCKRFNQNIKGNEIREKYGVSQADPVVGIVARVQPQRRFEVFLNAIVHTIKKIPKLKVFIIGRGSHIEEVAIKPVERLGIKNHVIFTGYHLEDYTRILAALDIKVFLVPGSDGSCRAVREAMAMGKPVIVAKRGILPEIVEDGVSGLVVEDTPENLADAIIGLIGDARVKGKMGEAARKRMSEDFNLRVQLVKNEEMYRKLKAYRT